MMTLMLTATLLMLFMMMVVVALMPPLCLVRYRKRHDRAGHWFRDKPSQKRAACDSRESFGTCTPGAVAVAPLGTVGPKCGKANGVHDTRLRCLLHWPGPRRARPCCR